MRKHVWALAGALAVGLLGAHPGSAAPDLVHRRGEGLQSSLLWFQENDWLFGDRAYTNGMALTWLGAEMAPEQVPIASLLPDALNLALTPLGTTVERSQWGLTAGQWMYTPGRFWRPEVRRLDQPFGGWGYFGLVHKLVGTHDTFQTWLLAGPLGPWSGAGQAQTLIHRYLIYWAPMPRGWPNQIADGLGLMARVRWEHTVIAVDGDHWRYLDLRSLVDTRAGTVMTSFALGAQARVGLMGRHCAPGALDPRVIDALMGSFVEKGSTLSAAAGWLLSEASRDFQMYLQVSVLPRLVAHHAMLNGTLFAANRHTVRHHPGVAEIDAAFVVKLAHLSWTAGAFLTSPEAKVNRGDGQVHWRLEGGFTW